MIQQNVPADEVDEILNAWLQGDQLNPPGGAEGDDDEVAEEGNADEASDDVGEVELEATEEVETEDGHEQQPEESSTSSSESESESGDEEAATEEVAEEAGTEDNHEETAAESGNEEASAEVAEPLWCICQDVEHGSMVACDNFYCPHLWFHYSCVGLKSAPRGRLWYCPNCSQKSSKK